MSTGRYWRGPGPARRRPVSGAARVSVQRRAVLALVVSPAGAGRVWSTQRGTRNSQPRSASLVAPGTVLRVQARLGAHGTMQTRAPCSSDADRRRVTGLAASGRGKEQWTPGGSRRRSEPAARQVSSLLRTFLAPAAHRATVDSTTANSLAQIDASRAKQRHGELLCNAPTPPAEGEQNTDRSRGVPQKIGTTCVGAYCRKAARPVSAHQECA